MYFVSVSLVILFHLLIHPSCASLDPDLVFNPIKKDAESTKRMFSTITDFIQVDVNFPILTPTVTMSMWIHPMGVVSFQSPNPGSWRNSENDVTNISTSVLAAFYSNPELNSQATLRYRSIDYMNDASCQEKAHISRYEQQIKLMFPQSTEFKTRGLVVIDWDEMENKLIRNQRNSIEVILLSDYVQTYAIWHFVTIGWTGSGPNNRLFPQAGMFVDNQNSIPLPLSNTNRMPSEWEIYTNCFVNGEWILKIGDKVEAPNPDGTRPSDISDLVSQLKGNLTICSPPSQEGCTNCHPDAQCVNVIGENCCLCKPGFIGNGNQCTMKDVGFNMLLNIQMNHNLVPGRGKTQGLLTLSVRRFSNLLTFGSFLDRTSQNILSALLPLYLFQTSLFGIPKSPDIPSLYFLINGYFEMSFQLDFNATGCPSITINMTSATISNLTQKKTNEVSWKIEVLRNSVANMDCILDKDFFEYEKSNRNYELLAVVEPSAIRLPQQWTMIRGRKTNSLVNINWSATLFTRKSCLMEKHMGKTIYVQIPYGNQRKFCQQNCMDSGLCNLDCLADPILFGSEPDPCEGILCGDFFAECKYKPGDKIGQCLCVEGFYKSGDSCKYGPDPTGCESCPRNSTCINDQCQCAPNFKLTDSGCIFDCEACRSIPNSFCTGSSCVCSSGYRMSASGQRCETSSAQCTRVEDCQENELCNDQGRCLCTTKKLQNGVCLPLNSYQCCSKRLPERAEMGECAADGSCQCRSGLKNFIRDNYCQECRSSDCDQNADCVQHAKWRYFHCQCRSGFLGDGYSCVNRESQAQIQSCNECHVFANCEMKADQPMKCACIAGYYGNGKECYPVLPGGCDCNYLQNPRAAYCDLQSRCQCRPGTMPGLSNECKECSRSPTLCHLHADCVANATVGYNYCKCRPGYSGNGFKCVRKGDRMDPCYYCPSDAQCADGRCICPPTTQLINDVCLQKRRCSSKNDCPMNQYCSEGRCTCPYSFVDGQCPATPNARCNPQCDRDATCIEGVCRCNAGFIGDGNVCTCRDGYVRIGSLCERIEYKVDIRPNQEIIRKEPGDTLELMCIYQTNDARVKPVWSRRSSYRPLSLEGFSVDYSSTEKALRMTLNAEDQAIYRCTLGTASKEVAIIVQDRKCSQTCHVFADCSYSGQCVCREGYVGDGVSECSSRDCSLNPRTCPDNSECIAGQCECRNGFEMRNNICVQGRNCVITRDCDRNSKCVVENGIPYCKCNMGYIKKEGYCRIDVGCNLRRNCVENAECVLRNLRFVCVCKSGYVGSGYSSCVKQVDCSLQPQPCGPNSVCDSSSFIDSMTGDRFYNGRCICMTGYSLTNDKCIDTRQLNTFFYTASGDALFRVPLISNDTQQSQIYHLDMNDSPAGIVATATDCKQKRVFWSSSEGRKIRYSNEGSPGVFEIYSGGGLIESMSVDIESGNLFFLDSVKREVSVINPVNKATKVVLTFESLRPKSLLVESEQKKLYFTSSTDSGQFRIEMSDYNGSNRIIFLNLTRPAIALASDTQSKRLCWISSSRKSMRSSLRIKRELMQGIQQDHGQIQCVSIRPEDDLVTQVITNIEITPPSIGLIVNDGAYYWTDRIRRQINQFISGRSVTLSVTPSCCGRSTLGLSIMTEQCSRLNVDNLCSQENRYGGCDQLCLMATDNFPQCYCPDGNLPCRTNNSK